MKRIILSGVLLTSALLDLPAMALPGHVWSHRYGDASSQVPNSVATDGSGNVWVTGRFYGTVDFGGGNLTATGAGSDVFLAKFNSAGVYLWSQRFGDASDQDASSVRTDVDGNVYLGGFFQGAVNFGGVALTSSGDRDIFIAKFNSDGVHQWSKRFGDAAEQRCLSIAVDYSTGNVFATGYFLGSVDFGGGALTGAGGQQAFLAKLNPAGTHQWSKQFGNAADQRGSSVTTDAYGSVFVVGPFDGTVNLGGSTLTSAGGYDIYFAKFNSAGTHQWSQRFGDSSDQEPRAVTTDHWGCVLLTGGMEGTADFGGGPLTSAGGVDAFVARFDGLGVHDWSQRFGDEGTQYGNSVATTASGDTYLAGDFDGTINLGGGDLNGFGATDFYLAMIDVWGVHQWSRRYGDSAPYQVVTSVATDPWDDMVATGFFQGTINLGSGPLTSAGSDDAFLAKFVTTLTGVGDRHDVLSISSSPNPFNPGTTVRYTLPVAGQVTIAVYDIRGALVATLVDTHTSAGPHTVGWNGHDDRGSPAGSGVYFARIVTASGTRSHKMTLLK